MAWIAKKFPKPGPKAFNRRSTMTRSTKKTPPPATKSKEENRPVPKPSAKNKEEQTRLQFPRRSGAV